MSHRTRWQTIRKVWAITGSAVFVLFTLWAVIAYQSWGVGSDLLATDGRIEVAATDTAIHFVPRSGAGTGLVFFSGALVDPEAYVPLARRIAERGHLVAIVKIPFRGGFNLADIGEVMRRGRAVMAKHRTVRRWAVGGHSKGGYWAAHFAHRHPQTVSALILVGTAHPRDLDLSQSPFAVTKIVASRDGLATPARVRGSAGNLPAETTWVRIEGGNHSQFGHYGFQPGDRPAKIGREEQQRRVLEAVLGALQAVQP